MSESTASIISVPATQHAVLAVQAGGPEVLQYRPDHVVALPGEQEVLIRNEFCGMNYVDTYFRNGLYPSPKPEVLGREGAGIIVTLGSGVTICSDLAVGDRVAWLGTGGYAQYTAVPVAKLIKLPARVSFQDAAASLLGGLTVLTLTEEAYHVRPGDWALVHAAAGSVGGMLVQVLKSLGAQVVATAGGPEKVAIVNNLGADHVIDYRDDKGPRWPKQVRAITAGAGVDVVYDSVGLDTWEGSLDVVKRKGTIVWFGNASGPVPPLSLQRLSAECVKVARPLLGGYIATRQEFEYYCTKLFGLLTQGKLELRVHKVYDLEGVQQAHKDIERRDTAGKLLIKIDHSN